MRISLFVLALLGAYLVFQVIRIGRDIAISKRLMANAVPFTQHPQQPSFRILVAGDSTGVGTGASSSTTSLAGLVGKRYLSAEIVNVSVNGAKTKDLIAQLNTASGTFDLLLIHVGANDTAYFTNLTALKKELHELLVTATQKSKYVLVTSSGNVGTAPLFPFPTRELLRKRTLAVRDIFMKEVATQGERVRYTDLYQNLSEDPFAKEPQRYFAADGYHPSDTGYQHWFTRMTQELDHFAL